MTSARKYRVLFEEGQFKELRAWIEVSACVPEARVVVAGAFAGLQPYDGMADTAENEYIVLLRPARLIALQNWKRPELLPRERWTALSADDLKTARARCAGS